jgi:hypothetical protein
MARITVHFGGPDVTGEATPKGLFPGEGVVRVGRSWSWSVARLPFADSPT